MLKPSVGLIALVVSACALGQGRAYEGPIIDMHVHAIPIEAFQHVTFCPGDSPKEFVAIDPGRRDASQPTESCSHPLENPTSDASALAQFAAIFERRDIRGVVIGEGDVMEAWKGELGERLIPALPVLFPDKIDLFGVRLRVERGEISVFGEVWSQQNGFSPSGPELEPLLALAEELDVPVGIHMGPGVPGLAYAAETSGYRARLTNPVELEEALIRHPKLRVYVMHAGYPMLDEMIHMLFSHPQLYVDISVINWYHPRAHFHHYLEKLVDAGFGKRIMFGSDQVIWPRALEIAIEAIETADFLTHEQREDIFHDNAARFLRLAPREE